MKYLKLTLFAFCFLPEILLGTDIACNVAGNISLKNSIVYNDLTYSQVASSVTVINSAIRGNTVFPGVGNMLFDNTNYKDQVSPIDTLSYYLDVNSALMNKGNSTIASYIPNKDINGNDRLYNDTIDIGAVEYSMVYSTGTNSWETPSHWNIGRIPTVNDLVSIRANCEVKSKTAVSRKILEIKENTSLTIDADQMLTISETINNKVPERLIIKSRHCEQELNANGSLIFHNDQNNPVYGTVEMYSKSSWDLSQAINQKYNWQYFGIPVDTIKASPTLDGSYVRELDEASTDFPTHWTSITNTSKITPFHGYEICYQTPRTITFKGKLINRNFNSGQLTRSTEPNVLFPGQHLLANPYLAAINISQLEFGSGMDSTVYLYNTGTFCQWESGLPGKKAQTPGQYTAATIGLAGQSNIPCQIPSMNSMLVRVINPGSNAFVNINYNATTEKNCELQRAPALPTTYTSTRIEVESESAIDRVWIFADNKFKKTFDNGYDAKKMIANALSQQIYAVENDENYQIDAIDNMNNISLAFQAGLDTEYTMTFIHTYLEKRYSKLLLIDLDEMETVDVTASGSSYKFRAESTAKPVNRFKIIAESNDLTTQEPSSIKYFHTNNQLIVNNESDNSGNVYIYDFSGKMLVHKAINKHELITLSMDSRTAYIVKTIAGDETKTEKFMFQNIN